MDLTLIVVASLLLAVIAAIVWAYRVGGANEAARVGRDRAEAEAAAAAEQLKMSTDAARIEREVGILTEAELEKELSRWAR